MKKFLVVAFVVVFILSSQIVFAAENINWDVAPRISNKAELARYVESERRKGKIKFYVVLTNRFRNENSDDFLGWALAPHVDMNWSYQADGTAQMIYEITEYPGTRVANAYLSGNTSNLTNEELKLYNVAVGIVNEANKLSSPLAKEIFIHDAICQITEFISNKNQDAIGALVYKKANCQGYTDAFYMLGRMCGLNVGRV